MAVPTEDGEAGRAGLLWDPHPRLAWFRKGSLVHGQREGEEGTAHLFYPRREYELGAGGVKSIGLPSNEAEN